jgi:hypothetical protein
MTLPGLIEKISLLKVSRVLQLLFKVDGLIAVKSVTQSAQDQSLDCTFAV